MKPTRSPFLLVSARQDQLDTEQTCLPSSSAPDHTLNNHLVYQSDKSFQKHQRNKLFLLWVSYNIFTDMFCYILHWHFHGGTDIKNLPASSGDAGLIHGLERSPEVEKGNHPSILAQKIPPTEETDRLQSMGSHRVRHDRVTELAYTMQYNVYHIKEILLKLHDVHYIS